MVHRLFPPAHPAILNADIVSIICESLDRNSLSVLARTAKVFLDPSLNRLWRNLCRIRYLLFPFQSFYDATDTKQVFPVPTPIQWDRFNFYARRVRGLAIQEMDYIEIGFFMLSPQQPLLPRLQELVVEEWSDPKTLCNMSIFFCDSLRKIDFHYRFHDLEDRLLLDPLIANLAATAPLLQHAQVWIRTKVAHEFGRSIPQFRNLCSIDVPLAGSQVHSVLSHLSTLPSLSVLKFDVTPSARLSGTGSIHTFPVARELEISSKSDTDSMNLMAITQFDNLTMIRIDCGHYQIQDESLFEAIAFCCGQSLNEINITDGLFYHSRLSIRESEFTFWYPLYKFTNLRTLYLINQSLPANEDIEGAAKSWPKLKRFSLRSFQFEDDRSTPLTLTGLLLLIEGCTSLVSLTISVDARQLPDITNRSNPIVRPRLAIEIYYLYSPLNCPVALANFFSVVLPDARIEVAKYCNEISDYKKLWKKVELLYPYFVKARQEERERVIKQVQEEKTLV